LWRVEEELKLTGKQAAESERRLVFHPFVSSEEKEKIIEKRRDDV
jgi:hypothetical protein